MQRRYDENEQQQRQLDAHSFNSTVHDNLCIGQGAAMQCLTKSWNDKTASEVSLYDSQYRHVPCPQ